MLAKTHYSDLQDFCGDPAPGKPPGYGDGLNGHDDTPVSDPPLPPSITDVEKPRRRKRTIKNIRARKYELGRECFVETAAAKPGYVIDHVVLMVPAELREQVSVTICTKRRRDPEKNEDNNDV
jgi:hypothetical protein